MAEFSKAIARLMEKKREQRAPADEDSPVREATPDAASEEDGAPGGRETAPGSGTKRLAAVLREMVSPAPAPPPPTTPARDRKSAVAAPPPAETPDPIAPPTPQMPDPSIGRFPDPSAQSEPAPVSPATAAPDSTTHDLLREWDHRLRQHLNAVYGPGEADRLAAAYARIFPPAYKAATDMPAVLADIRALEALAADGRAQIELTTHTGDPDRSLTALKLYLPNERLVLSDFIPVLENLGLRVFAEDTILLAAGGAPVHMQTFLVRDALLGQLDVARAAPLLVPALHALRADKLENDPLNRLILHAGLEWRPVELLRTYVEHARQIGVAASRATVIEALTAHPNSARRLFRFFATKFDPAASSLGPAERQRGPVAEAEAGFLKSLDQVDSLRHDQILRALGVAVAATVRTSFYCPPVEGPEGTAIAIKLDDSRLAHLPPPRPRCEIYVHAPHVEGIHLRAGAVARGGIRLSDRPGDFRTEILGLIKTQTVKNAVIVPTGAKGGFVVKGPSRDPLVPFAEVERAYRTLVGSMLSLTDNLEDGHLTPPAGQVIYDEPDPYLVVAADKGTAALSDTANTVAARRRFWLGDAFASGGSHGYDHKKVGITARGAWECMRQHFREAGRDADTEPVTVIGIGDMSGDVFGNGLLRGRTIRLLAAFNHEHIFLDPNPDPELSYRERERLFHLPRSGWNDYDPSLISPGGGVFARRAKSVPLLSAAKEMLGIEQDALPGEEIVRAILRLKADLLWNGGIGTYVKASDESHAEVGDPLNDGVRVDAGELRVAVVAEGGNLGFTQRARVEFALRGGRINTDAVDNSGGVDLSDHEVNLKIALQPLVVNHELTVDDRNALLQALCDEVCEAVLAHNRRQALVLGLDQLRSRTRLIAFRELMTMLEGRAGLDRQIEHLPTRELLRERRSTFLGLTRPELAVVLAYTKIDLQHRLLGSALVDDPDLERYLLDYFPARLHEGFAHALRDHRLRREITAVTLANRLVDSMGMTFVSRVAANTGRSEIDVARAWAAAAAVADADGVMRAIDTAPARMRPEAVVECATAVDRALEQATKWLLRFPGAPGPIAELVTRFHEPVRRLLSRWLEWLPDEIAEAHRLEAARLTDMGVDPALVAGVGRLAALADALEISHLASELQIGIETVAPAYVRAATVVDTQWVQQSLGAMANSDDRWERRAVEGLLEGLLYARRRLARNILACRRDGCSVEPCLQEYRAAHREQIESLRQLTDDLKTMGRPTLAGILVVMRELGRLTEAV